MLPQYVVCVMNAFTKSEEIVLVSREEYNPYRHEPICGHDNKEQTEEMLAEVKELGVQGYLKKLIKQEGTIKI